VSVFGNSGGVAPPARSAAPASGALAGAVFVFCLFGAAVAVSAQSLFSFPVIRRLGAGDVVFRQFEDDVREGRRVFGSIAGNRPGQGLSLADWAGRLIIYAYTTREDDVVDDTVRGIAARCNVTQVSIATLNRISHDDGVGERTVLLPTVSGVFIPQEPASDMERLLFSARNPDDGVTITVAGTRFLFFPGDEFSPTERSFFLSRGRFQFPLRTFTVTSRFGSRVNPISGAVRFHGGLDLAAPMGTEVYAAGEGVVAECGENAVYGIFVIVRHDAVWTSLYGHLSAVLVKQGESIEKGRTLGRVGSTGQSTGPHLHFELRQNGRAADPQALLKR
jgi:murein DD-endopeptidase MepM/ murein hydrolase activator NlpD